MTNAYSNWQAPLFKDESRRTKHLDIPLYGRFKVVDFPVGRLWKVEYISNGKTLTGYIEDRFMEWYEENLPHDLVDMRAIQTPETNDAEQYVIWDAKRQYNQCGQICVSYILGLPLADVLEKWKTLDVPFYKRVMGASGKTGNYDLIRLLDLFGMTASPLTIKKYTPRLFAELVKQAKGVIVSVHLNTSNGSIAGGSVLHWSVVTQVVPEGIEAGWVFLYNPFTNSIQKLSWREFLSTTRSPYGVIA